MTEPRNYKVLTQRRDGSGFEFVDVTAEQFERYMAGDPAWRSSATDDKLALTGEFLTRTWRRIAGRRTPG